MNPTMGHPISRLVATIQAILVGSIGIVSVGMGLAVLTLSVQPDGVVGLALGMLAAGMAAMLLSWRLWRRREEGPVGPAPAAPLSSLVRSLQHRERPAPSAPARRELEQLARLAESPEPRQRCQAVLTAELMPGASADAVLQCLAGDADPEVRRRAHAAIARRSAAA